MKCCADRMDSISGACFSEDRHRRFVLWRNWDASRPVMAALMLNPSIADENDLDPTLRRVQRYAMDWGFGGMRIVNAFAWVATDPDDLRSLAVDSDHQNDLHIIDVIEKVRRVMVGWGGTMDKPYLKHRRSPLDWLIEEYAARSGAEVMAWKMTATEQPWHPLYLPADIQPVPYRGVAA